MSRVATTALPRASGVSSSDPDCSGIIAGGTVTPSSVRASQNSNHSASRARSNPSRFPSNIRAPCPTTHEVSENMFEPSISLAYTPSGRPRWIVRSQSAYWAHVMSSVGAGAPVDATTSAL